MLPNNFIPTLTALLRLSRWRPRPILAKDVDSVCIYPLYALATLLPVHGVASVNRDIATVDDGAHGVDAVVLIGAERAIGYRYGHRVFLRRVVVVDFRPRPADSDGGFLVGYIKAEIVDVVAQSFGARVGS